MDIFFPCEAEYPFHQASATEATGNELSGEGNAIHDGADVLGCRVEALELLQNVAGEGGAVAVKTGTLGNVVIVIWHRLFPLWVCPNGNDCV